MNNDDIKYHNWKQQELNKNENFISFYHVYGCFFWHNNSNFESFYEI